ncbi:hypothetical protein Cgig2_032170 [Carnegiea gigantea]|uniref:Glabrous enhancer-binding protein-like DBD domain-containing protein n=1 Tax=Carnegiea gigantea TaxID=171969 RepID=A0A9Q1JFN8_9CARY|nr:hypothetical protein Cgig2_032170 [Carnegiea gigantea]
MIDYKAKKGTDPMADADDFLEFIKKSLHFDANKAQILNKMQRMKKKYENAKKRKINNPHDLKAFELSKQVWGNDGVEDNGDGENHNFTLNAKGSRASNSKLKANKGGVNGLALDVGKKLEGRKEEDQVADWVISRFEREMPIIGGSSIGYLNEGVLKEGMKLLGERERAELTEKLRKHNLAEMEGEGTRAIGTHIGHILEELISKLLEGLLLLLGLRIDDGVKIISQVLGLESKVVLDIRPFLLVNVLLDVTARWRGRWADGDGLRLGLGSLLRYSSPDKRSRSQPSGNKAQHGSPAGLNSLSGDLLLGPDGQAQSRRDSQAGAPGPTKARAAELEAAFQHCLRRATQLSKQQEVKGRGIIPKPMLS